jgi:hypothetical protein
MLLSRSKHPHYHVSVLPFRQNYPGSDGLMDPLSSVSSRLSSCLLAVLLVAGLLSSPVMAQTLPVPPAYAKPAGATQSHLTKPLPSVRNPKVVTPFDRVLAPRMYETMQKVAAEKGATSSASATRLKANYSGAGGTNVNFPGFVGAPYSTLSSLVNTSSYESYATVAGDFNNDGYPDIASATSGGTISVILNPGTKGNIAQGVQVAPNNTVNSFAYVFWLQAVDLNGDGNLDLVGADNFGNQLLVWLGNGDGTFQSVVKYPVQTTSGASLSAFGGGSAFVIGDFNGDGKPDVGLVMLGSGFETTPLTTQVYLNDGKGNLTPAAETDSVLQDGYSSAFTGQADVITDGKKVTGIAFLVADQGNKIAANAGIDLLVLSSNGDGTLAHAVEPTAPMIGNDATYVEIPKSRLAATSLTTKGTAGTTVATTDFVFITGDGAVYDAPYTAQAGSSAIASARMIAGANEELQSAPRTEPLVAGKALASSTSSSASPFPFLQAISVADVNQDGYPDLFVYTSGSIYVYLNGGDGTFATEPAQLVGGFAASEQPQPQDFNKSGNVSFVEFDSQILQYGYFQGDGTGHFYGAPGVSGASDATAFATDDEIVVQTSADFNGDGLLDVVAQDWSNAGLPANNGYPDIVLGINNGKPAPANQSNNFKFTRILTGAQFAAMNGAFLQPVAVPNPTGGSNVLLSTSDGGLYSIAIKNDVASAPSVVLPPGQVQCTVNFADAGDINGDGIADIVVAYGGASSCGANGIPAAFLTFFGNPDGTYHQAGLTALGTQLYQAKLVDLNGDGILDLAISNNNGGTGDFGVYILPNNADGSGTFNMNAMTEILQNYVATDLIAGDYNGDGKQDLTVATEGQIDSTGTLVLNSWGLLLAPGNGDFTFGTTTTIDTGYWPAWGSYADFNGDGTPDLALAVYGDSTTIENLANVYVPSPPIVQVLPNLGGGAFGPAIGEFDGFNFDLRTLRGQTAYTYSAYTFTGNFGAGTDLLISGFYNSAEYLNQGTDVLGLTSSAATASLGADVTLTATLTQPIANQNQPSGNVSFFANGSLIGSTAIGATGIAALTTSELPAGTDAITAVYAGDAHFNGASAKVSIAVAALAPDFAISAAPAGLTLIQGQTGVVTLSLAANTTFAGTVTFSCTGTPGESTCSVNPGTVRLTAGQSGTATLVIATSAQGGAYQAKLDGRWQKTAGGLSVAGLLLMLLPRRRRMPRVLALIVLLTLGLATATMSGCSGSSNKGTPVVSTPTGTPVGSTTLTITATSGSITHSQTITMQVSAQ